MIASPPVSAVRSELVYTAVEIDREAEMILINLRLHPISTLLPSERSAAS